jgi:hypothetical protein
LDAIDGGRVQNALGSVALGMFRSLVRLPGSAWKWFQNLPSGHLSVGRSVQILEIQAYSSGLNIAAALT